MLKRECNIHNVNAGLINNNTLLMSVECAFMAIYFIYNRVRRGVLIKSYNCECLRKIRY